MPDDPDALLRLFSLETPATRSASVAWLWLIPGLLLGYLLGSLSPF